MSYDFIILLLLLLLAIYSLIIIQSVIYYYKSCGGLMNIDVAAPGNPVALQKKCKESDPMVDSTVN